MTRPFPNFNNATNEAWGRMSYLIPHHLMDVLTTHAVIILVNIVSGNGLMLDETQPLHEPMLTHR